MPNGPFQPGVWNRLPTNCTSGWWLTFQRCAEYGTTAILECVQWVTSWETECVEWAWSETKKCSWWSWFFCVLFAIIVTAVCVATATVAITVCAVFTVVEIVVCLLWATVTFFLCNSTANGGTAFLLTDGTVMMQEFSSLNVGVAHPTWATRRWWKLTPDPAGSYRNGSWSRLADSHLARSYFAGGVLADGRVLVCGGEYSDASGSVHQDDTASCEIYDPVTDAWTLFDPPTKPGGAASWAEIGDGPGAVLADGTFLLASIDGPYAARLDPATLTWAPTAARSDGVSIGEESFVLMPDGTVATPSCYNPGRNWIYDPVADQWRLGNDAPLSIIGAGDSEIGPGLLRYDGTAIWFGASDDDSGSAHTTVYAPTASPQWKNGPDLPDVTQDGQPAHTGIHDGPAATLANGNILVAVGKKVGVDLSSATWSQPAWFFEFDGTSFQRTSDPPDNGFYTYGTRLLLLPDGDVLFCAEDDDAFYAYHSEAAVPQDSFRPVIQACPNTFAPGTTIQVSGLQFNGLSQAVGYGDDSQTATNYPLVRILNKQTGRLRYCRTSGHSRLDGNGNPVPSMGVATGAAVVTTQVDVPADIDTGDSTLFVVANGIPSAGFDVAIWPILV
ncbi:MAG TPA: hypothetical protein VMU15_14235 [Anaeromyxobacter sp.]|nr:hypothetical protein [Anaeromyxobacter sp.]